MICTRCEVDIGASVHPMCSVCSSADRRYFGISPLSAAARRVLVAALEHERIDEDNNEEFEACVEELFSATSAYALSIAQRGTNV